MNKVRRGSSRDLEYGGTGNKRRMLREWCRDGKVRGSGVRVVRG